MAPNICSTFHKDYSVLVKMSLYFEILISLKDKCKDITKIFILNQRGVTPSTKLTFTVSLHQQLKINSGQKLVHSDDTFYMTD